MSSLSLLLYLAFQRSDGTISLAHENIMKQIPTTISSVLSKSPLDAKTIVYAICCCHCTYAPTYVPGSKTPIYPDHCTYFLTPEAQCKEPLLKTNSHPMKSFIYHDFKNYLGSLLSQPDIKILMDLSCDHLQGSLSLQPHLIKNPFEAQFLQNFWGPDSNKLFVDWGAEGHYAFSLHVDFFNPEGMIIWSLSTSCGIISMACLNLPKDIWYKPENLYLAGIIPGSKQPSLENLNHYLRPLINDLVPAWDQGIQFSRTANHFEGWLTHSAIALVVCDLPTTCHVAAFASVGSHFFCSACNCYHKANYGRVDFQNSMTKTNSVNMLNNGKMQQHPLSVNGYSRSMVFTTWNYGNCHTGILLANL